MNKLFNTYSVDTIEKMQKDCHGIPEMDATQALTPELRDMFKFDYSGDGWLEEQFRDC